MDRRVKIRMPDADMRMFGEKTKRLVETLKVSASNVPTEMRNTVSPDGFEIRLRLFAEANPGQAQSFA